MGHFGLHFSDLTVCLHNSPIILVEFNIIIYSLRMRQNTINVVLNSSVNKKVFQKTNKDMFARKPFIGFSIG